MLVNLYKVRSILQTKVFTVETLRFQRKHEKVFTDSSWQQLPSFRVEKRRQCQLLGPFVQLDRQQLGHVAGPRSIEITDTRFVCTGRLARTRRQTLDIAAQSFGT